MTRSRSGRQAGFQHGENCHSTLKSEIDCSASIPSRVATVRLWSAFLQVVQYDVRHDATRVLNYFCGENYSLSLFRIVKFGFAWRRIGLLLAVVVGFFSDPLKLLDKVGPIGFVLAPCVVLIVLLQLIVTRRKLKSAHQQLVMLNLAGAVVVRAALLLEQLLICAIAVVFTLKVTQSGFAVVAAGCVLVIVAVLVNESSYSRLLVSAGLVLSVGGAIWTSFSYFSVIKEFAVPKFLLTSGGASGTGILASWVGFAVGLGGILVSGLGVGVAIRLAARKFWQPSGIEVVSRARLLGLLAGVLVWGGGLVVTRIEMLWSARFPMVIAVAFIAVLIVRVKLVRVGSAEGLGLLLLTIRDFTKIPVSRLWRPYLLAGFALVIPIYFSALVVLVLLGADGGVLLFTLCLVLLEFVIDWLILLSATVVIPASQIDQLFSKSRSGIGAVAVFVIIVSLSGILGPKASRILGEVGVLWWWGCLIVVVLAVLIMLLIRLEVNEWYPSLKQTVRTAEISKSKD